MFGQGPHEPDVDGKRKVAAAFVLASTAPPLPANMLTDRPSDAVEYVRSLVSAPANAPLLSGLGFWSSASGRRPRARRLSARAAATYLGGINHDVTYSGDGLTVASRALAYADLFEEDGPWGVNLMAEHMGDTELSYLLANGGTWDDWDILYDENPGITAYNRVMVHGALYGTDPPEGPPEEGEAHFFAGCDEHHEPLGMGLAIYAFERDDARPGRAKTVAVFASESEISP